MSAISKDIRSSASDRLLFSPCCKFKELEGGGCFLGNGGALVDKGGGGGAFVDKGARGVLAFFWDMGQSDSCEKVTLCMGLRSTWILAHVEFGLETVLLIEIAGELSILIVSACFCAICGVYLCPTDRRSEKRGKLRTEVSWLVAARRINK